MEMLKKKFENYSIRELEELIDNNSVSSITEESNMYLQGTIC